MSTAMVAFWNGVLANVFGGGAPAAASRSALSRRLSGAVLAVVLAWIGACATVSPPQIAADLDLPSPGAGLKVLEIDQVATLPGVLVLIAPDFIADADAVLAALRDASDALLLTGRIAEDRHDWEIAMVSYEALPADDPQRTPALLRAKLQWRSSNLPMCAQQALVSPVLTRAELAILLVSLTPQLESVGIGRPLVLSDIVDQPCYGEVLTAVRCDLFAVDRLEHRFFPLRAARPEEVRSAVEGMCRILDLNPPVWCPGEEVTAGCALISIPVRGEQVAALVSQLTETNRP